MVGPHHWCLQLCQTVSKLNKSLCKCAKIICTFPVKKTMQNTYLLSNNFSLTKSCSLTVSDILDPCTALHFTTLNCSLYYTTRHYTILHCTVLYCTTRHYTVLNYTALPFIALPCTTLQYTVLQCPALLYSELVCTTVLTFSWVDSGSFCQCSVPVQCTV